MAADKKANVKNTETEYREPQSRNYNALTILMASEGLKPYAMKQRMELTEEDVALCKVALQALKKDSIAYHTVVDGIKNRNDASLGVLASRLAFGMSDKGSSTSEMIENMKNGENSTGEEYLENKRIDYSFKTLMENTDYAIESLERAIKNRSWSILDAEKASRCIAYTAEPVSRRVSLELYGSETKPEAGTEPNTSIPSEVLTTLSNRIDQRLQGDLYAVSRRLVLKYYGGASLDELDGILKVNPVTGETKELGLLERMDFNIDPESGIRYLTPKSMLAFTDKFKNKKIQNENSLKAAGSLDISLTLSDQAMVENAIAKIRIGAMLSNDNNTEPAEEVVKRTLDAMGLKSEPDNQVKTGKAFIDGAEYRRWLMKTNMNIADASNSLSDLYDFSLDDIAGEFKSGTLNYLYEKYLTGYRLYKNVSSFGYESSEQASFVDNKAASDTMNRKSDFPYDVSNPIQKKSPRTLVGLMLSAEEAVLRINALPLERILYAGKNGNALIEKAGKIKKDCLAIAKNTRSELCDEFLQLTEDQIRDRLNEALKGQQMKPNMRGWLCNEDRRKIFAEKAEAALNAVRDISDPEIISAVLNILDNSTDASVEKDDRKTVEKVIRDENGAELQRVNMIAPPPQEKMTASVRFRILNGCSVTSDIDKAVNDNPENGLPTVYSDSTGTILDECARVFLREPQSDADKETSWKNAITGYEKTMEIINAVKTAGGGNCRCVKIMEEAEDEVRDKFITDYVNNIDILKKSVELLDSINSRGDEKTDCFSNDYMAAGKTFGEIVLGKLADRVLEKSGVRNEIRYLYQRSSLKDRLEDIAGSPDEVNEKYRELHKELLQKSTENNASTTEELKKYIENTPMDEKVSVAFNKLSEWSEKVDKALEKLTAVTDYVISETAVAITDSAVEKIDNDIKYAASQVGRYTRWHDREGEKGSLNSTYGPIVIGTLPYMTNKSLKAALEKEVLRYKEAEELSKLSLFDTKTVKASAVFEQYKNLIEQDKEQLSERVRRNSQSADIKAAWDDAEKIRAEILTWEDNDKSRNAVEQLLVKLSVDNPLILDDINKFRKEFRAWDDQSLVSRMNFSRQVDDLETTTAFTKTNSDCDRDYLMSCEFENVINVHRDSEREKAQLESYNRIDSETLALVNIAFTNLFAPEKGLLKDIDMSKYSLEDRIKAETVVSKAITEVEKEVGQDVYVLTANAVIKSFKNTGINIEKSAVKMQLPRTESVKAVILPTNDRILTITDEENDILGKQGFTNSSPYKTGLNLREGTLNKTLNSKKEDITRDDRNGTMTQPYRIGLKRMDCYKNLYNEETGNWMKLGKLPKLDKNADERTLDKFSRMQSNSAKAVEVMHSLKSTYEEKVTAIKSQTARTKAYKSL